MSGRQTWHSLLTLHTRDQNVIHWGLWFYLWISPWIACQCSTPWTLGEFPSLPISIPCPYSPPVPLRSRPPLWLEGLGERISSPCNRSGGRSPAARGIWCILGVNLHPLIAYWRIVSCVYCPLKERFLLIYLWFMFPVKKSGESCRSTGSEWLHRRCRLLNPCSASAAYPRISTACRIFRVLCSGREMSQSQLSPICSVWHVCVYFFYVFACACGLNPAFGCQK